MRAKLLAVLSIILCSKIADEVDNLHSECRITDEQHRAIICPGGELTITIPEAFPEGKFAEFAEKTLDQGIFKENIRVDPNSFDAKDLAFHFLGFENNLPKYLENKFFDDSAEFVIQNAVDDFLDDMRKE